MQEVLKTLLKNLADLLKVKSLISIAVVFTTCFLTCNGTIEVAIFMSMATAIITYYFTKDNNKNEKESEDK
jgi:hypothetical protein